MEGRSTRSLMCFLSVLESEWIWTGVKSTGSILDETGTKVGFLAVSRYD